MDKYLLVFIFGMFWEQVASKLLQLQQFTPQWWLEAIGGVMVVSAITHTIWEKYYA